MKINNNHQICLEFNSVYIQSYKGRKDYPFYKAHNKTKIKKEDWDKAKKELIQYGFLNKDGSINKKGKDIRFDYLMKQHAIKDKKIFEQQSLFNKEVFNILKNKK